MEYDYNELTSGQIITEHVELLKTDRDSDSIDFSTTEIAKQMAVQLRGIRIMEGALTAIKLLKYFEDKYIENAKETFFVPENLE